jgi:hypothetical protein
MKTQHPACRIPRLRKRHGRCYELAFRGACRAQEWLIVHGECVGPLGCGRMGHAWLQSGESVYDPVLDRTYNLEDYRTQFAAVEHARYTFLAASRQASSSGHVGPWT